jgi:EAL domain-containing protein (putative c-di-GMP-specific phosphodiesterase class I)
LRETGLDARYLELEVTETTVMHDAEQLIWTLEQLRALGVHLAIDDFGTGYSSLSYLKRFAIDKIKIDRSFIRDIPADQDDHSIVRAIIGLGKQLNLIVVAEGVETSEQLAALRDSDCDALQGFYFSRPLPVTGIEELLRAVTKLT